MASLLKTPRRGIACATRLWRNLREGAELDLSFRASRARCGAGSTSTSTSGQCQWLQCVSAVTPVRLTRRPRVGAACAPVQVFVRPMKQCKACPWKVSTVPARDIPNGYCAEGHARLRRTIADDPMYAGTTMACHETPVGRERPCVGWVAHQLGRGNNLKLRLQARDGRFKNYKLDGEQHQTFEATLGVST